MSKFTLFTECLNGEPLLPFWLEHHRQLFDHGVIVLYPSKDRSESIIREICPDWEIVKPVKHREYSCAGVDEEIMIQEARHTGWKLALNVTEFAVAQDLSAVVRSVPAKTRCILPIDVAVMVDTPDTVNERLHPDIPLLEQKHHGVFSKDYLLWRCRHFRQLHQASNGQYDVGRHNSRVKPQAKSPLFYIAWFAWSPYRIIYVRKLAVQKQLSKVDIKVRRGWQHHVTPDEQDARFNRVSNIAYDLNRNPGYRAASGAGR
jgi:hypothetical protein